MAATAKRKRETAVVPNGATNDNSVKKYRPLVANPNTLLQALVRALTCTRSDQGIPVAVLIDMIHEYARVSFIRTHGIRDLHGVDVVGTDYSEEAGVFFLTRETVLWESDVFALRTINGTRPDNSNPWKMHNAGAQLTHICRDPTQSDTFWIASEIPQGVSVNRFLILDGHGFYTDGRCYVNPDHARSVTQLSTRPSDGKMFFAARGLRVLVNTHQQSICLDGKEWYKTLGHMYSDGTDTFTFSKTSPVMFCTDGRYIVKYDPDSGESEIVLKTTQSPPEWDIGRIEWISDETLAVVELSSMSIRFVDIVQHTMSEPLCRIGNLDLFERVSHSTLINGRWILGFACRTVLDILL